MHIIFSPSLCEILDAEGQKKPAFSKQNAAAYEAWKNNIWELLFRAWCRDQIEKKREDDKLTIILGELAGKHSMQEVRDHLPEAIETFVSNLRSYTPDQRSFAAYTASALKRNLNRLINVTAAVDSSGGVLMPSQAKRISAGRVALEKQIAGLPLEEQERRRSKYAQEHHVSRAPLMIKDEETGDERENPLLFQFIDDLDEPVRIQVYLFEMATQIINLMAGRATVRSDSKKRIMYPLWYTEKTVWILQENYPADFEQEIMQALSYAYMDFFLESNCRSIAEIRASELCYADRIYPDDGHKRLEWNSRIWLPAKVPKEFLKPILAVGDDSVSKNRKDYSNELKQILLGAQ